MRSSQRYRSESGPAIALGLLVAVGAATSHCGGDSFTAAVDAGGADTGSSDALVDQSVGDAGNGGDAEGGAIDASGDDTGVIDAGDAAPPPFSCSSPPSGTLLCADFDTVNDPKDNWDLEVAYGGGAVAFDTINSVSPPKGLATSHGIITGAAGASLSRAFTSAATTIDYGFSLRVTKLDTVNDATIIAARLAVGEAHDLFLDLQIDRKGARLHQAVPQGDGGSIDELDTIASSVPLDKWLRIRIVLDRSAPAVRVFVDDVKIVDKPPLTQNIKATKLEADVGMVFVQPPSTGNAISYDNVLVRGL